MNLETPTPVIIGQPLSDSGFHVWRCIVAVAHADGIVQDAELDHLKKIFAGMERDGLLNADQREVLGQDLVSPQNISTLLKKVTSPADRVQLAYAAALMAQASGDLAPGEEDIIRKISAGTLGDAEVNQLLNDVRRALEDQATQEALARAKAERPIGLRAIVRFILNKIYD
ncbi:MAG: TerB family tellurite resistance protein [Alphaproteobacteria bacterium]